MFCFNFKLDFVIFNPPSIKCGFYGVLGTYNLLKANTKTLQTYQTVVIVCTVSIKCPDVSLHLKACGLVCSLHVKLISAPCWRLWGLLGETTIMGCWWSPSKQLLLGTIELLWCADLKTPANFAHYAVKVFNSHHHIGLTIVWLR